MHSETSVPDFDAAHDSETFYDQSFQHLGAFASLEAVPSHEGGDLHRDCPGFGDADDAATHEGVYRDRRLVAFDVCIPEVDVKSAHESDQIAATEVFRADA